MQCKHCGSIIRDNVKYCTMCGRSVFEVRNSIINNETTDKMKEQVINVGNKVADNVKNVSNKVAENIKNIDTDKMKEQFKNAGNKVAENIKNIDTDKMKEQFKNVGNNVVENVKNFDKEQAKQQTINFANNVKTDVKNFKTLDKKKQIVFISIAVVIVCMILALFSGGGNSYTKKSNNFYGMRFKKTITEFCEDYNNSLETIYNELGESTDAIGIWKINPSSFSYISTDSTTNLKQYSAKRKQL